MRQLPLDFTKSAAVQSGSVLHKSRHRDGCAELYDVSVMMTQSTEAALFGAIFVLVVLAHCFAMVGADDGTTVGTPVGVAVVGVNVGAPVVGVSVGASVGASDGAVVGNGVRTM